GVIVFMKTSKIGRAIRATAQNARAAKILGIDTDRVYAATFALNAALCGVAGALVAATFTIHPYIGLPYTVRSFMIVVVAGVGNLPGVIAAAFGLGAAEELSDYVLGAEFRLAFVFSLLVAILVWRNWRLTKKRLYLK
ncbi:MAG: branched-chain amino acid ABC transporter permease, partial [Gammaproteobacteria bacterium]